ncbi:MAG: hypothetical protein A2X78_01435 [Gammaproteobacteria bacterium GWE2_37_16]|nr:MAG: hypothetical protein A2X78_01435 [Gammaproteobacteria bacterium GWE2_37_16]
MKNKKFGMGQLDAILKVNQSTIKDIEENDSIGIQNNAKLQKLPVSMLSSGSYQPRMDFNEEALSELKLSIKKHGILQPLIVRKKNNQYEIVAGERRWRAAKLIGLTEVPVVVYDITDETTLVFGLIENIQRHDLNAIEEARSLQRLINEFSMTHEKVAEIVGKSRVYITNLIRLLALPNSIQEMITKNLLEMGHARAILTLPEKEQLRVANEIINKKLSVRDVEKLVQMIKSDTDLSLANKTQKEGRVVELEKQLAEKFSGKVNIILGKNGKGRVLVHFDSIAKIEWLLECLGNNIS